MSDSSTHPFVSTGVPGLDHVLMGGILRGGFYLAQGDPGSGKTTLALRYMLSRAAAGERCLYVSLTESRRDLENACRSHGWKLDGVDVLDLTRSAANTAGVAETSVFHPADTELGETTRAILDVVARVNPANVVFDGLAEMRLLAGDPLRYRRQLLALKEFFADRGATVLLLDDRSAQFAGVQPESLVGGNLVMERYLPAYGRARRRLYVTKVRGADFREGYHDYEIRSGEGVMVHPRLVAAEHQAEFPGDLRASGIPNLDAMLGGGLSPGCTTLLLGPAGVGKSTVAMQFAVQALKGGERVAVYLFDEILRMLLERCDKLCLGTPGGLSGYLAGGQLHAQQVDPAELSPGAFAHEIRRAVDAGAKVVIIDSLNGYLNSMPEERFLTTHLHELFSYLNQQGVLTLVVAAQHGMGLVGRGADGDLDVSYLADSVLLFRYFETRGEIRQAVSVFKKRTGAHERTIRQMRIDATGLRVGDPLENFRGVMTGVPEYDGNTAVMADTPPAPPSGEKS
jgi:circadian clock protein KaiC